jgi:nicotinate phosphoribosyltransferase
MAHSYVMTVGDEREAFRRFARKFPSNAVFLIDTFDTIEGARAAVDVAEELAQEGISIRAVRIDSGDLLTLSKRVRGILDDAGHPEIEIFASSELNEFRIDSLLTAGAPIDGFGVGTDLGTGGDVSHLGGAYKLVHDSTGPKFKLSTGKRTLPGVKQVYRYSDSDGAYQTDFVALEDEPVDPPGLPLLQKVMVDGRRSVSLPELPALQEKCRGTLSALPPRLLSLETVESYPVRLSGGLQDLADEARQSTRLSGV